MSEIKITISGPQGAGKSRLAAILAAYLGEGLGLTVVAEVGEPGPVAGIKGPIKIETTNEEAGAKFDPIPTYCEFLDQINNVNDVMDEVEEEVGRAYQSDSEADHVERVGNAEEALQNAAGIIDRMRYTITYNGAILPSKKCGECEGCECEEYSK